MKTNQRIRPSQNEITTRKKLLELFKKSPIPEESILDNLELFLRPQRLSEVFTLEKLYRKILDTHGVVMEFGVRWGRHLSVLSALRATYEPYNFYRRIVGFDTFSGFLSPDSKDGDSDKVFKGSMAVSKNYQEYLMKVLNLHEEEAPMSHISRTELIKGDAPIELSKFFNKHPETLIAFAYFDMDVYKPTKECLEIVLKHMSKGGLIAFDELSHPEFPGEALALKEVIDINQHKIQRFPHIPYPAFIQI